MLIYIHTSIKSKICTAHYYYYCYFKHLKNRVWNKNLTLLQTFIWLFFKSNNYEILILVMYLTELVLQCSLLHTGMVFTLATTCVLALCHSMFPWKTSMTNCTANLLLERYYIIRPLIVKLLISRFFLLDIPIFFSKCV